MLRCSSTPVRREPKRRYGRSCHSWCAGVARAADGRLAASRGPDSGGADLAIIARSSHRAGAYPPPQGPQLWASCCSRVVDVARRWLACSVISSRRPLSAAFVGAARCCRPPRPSRCARALVRWCAARCCSRTMCKLSRVSCIDSAVRLICCVLAGPMSSDAFSLAQEYQRKAGELRAKGHILRAAQYYGRAAEVARDLDPGPDNLAVVNMQFQQAHCLMVYLSAASKTSDQVTVNPGSLAAQRAECVALLSAVVAALERRQVAGTLLEGRCTAAEEAWLATQVYIPNTVSAADASDRLRMVGYETVLNVATAVLDVLVSVRFFENDCSSAQFHSYARLVVTAAEMMQRPHPLATRRFSPEIGFARKFHFHLPSFTTGCGLDPQLDLLLTETWQRLLQSGTLDRRGILDKLGCENDIFGHAVNAINAAINAAITSPSLRSCALESCGTREAHPQHFKQCAACRTVVYCCKEHQLEDWPTHKAACKAARKASAAAADRCAGPGAAP